MTYPHPQPRSAGTFARNRGQRPAAGAARAARTARATGGACVVWTLVASCVVLAACGHDGGVAPASGRSNAAGTAGTAGGPLPDACELLTPADVDAVTRDASGSLSSTLEDAVGKDPTLCSYSLAGDVPPRMISLSLRRAPGAEEAASRQQTAEAGLRSIAAGAPVEELPGLGDGAFWIGGRIDQLNVRRGDTLLVFTVQLDKDPLGVARTLAGKALARLARPAPVPRPAPPSKPPPPPGPASHAAPGATGGSPRSSGMS
ncbi:MAG TPA: hypothetical protein VHB47_11650 [Thermoanaerobaculia bacterium]|nr:hypothetical protein [Thermoanaerobaculia bacterium]